MKLLRKILWLVAVLLLSAAALLWWLPARWAMPLLQPSLHGLRLQQVAGTLWNGQAGQVLTANGKDLGRLQWQLSRRALVGSTDVQLDLDGPSFGLRGHMNNLPGGRVAWHDVQAHVDLSALADPRLHLPMGQVQGELQIRLENAVLQGGWPLEMQADWQWRPAALRTNSGIVALGGLHGKLEAHEGTIRAQWQDDGNGPLRTDGELQLSPLGWRVSAELQARGDDPALRRWLATLGRPAADGTLHLERRGGLAAFSIKGNTAR